MTTTLACTTRTPAGGRRHTCSPAHYQVVTEYRLAREAAEQARDAAVGVYGPHSPEWREYTSTTNMIVFRSWLINLRGQR